MHEDNHLKVASEEVERQGSQPDSVGHLRSQPTASNLDRHGPCIRFQVSLDFLPVSVNWKSCNQGAFLSCRHPRTSAHTPTAFRKSTACGHRGGTVTQMQSVCRAGHVGQGMTVSQKHRWEPFPSRVLTPRRPLEDGAWAGGDQGSPVPKFRTEARGLGVAT